MTKKVFSDFEDALLVAIYLVTEETGEDYLSIQSVLDSYPLAYKTHWIMRALESFVRSGISEDARTLNGDPLEQAVNLTSYGLRQAENLIDAGMEPSNPDRWPGGNAAGTAPAADRIVSLKDNQETVQVVRSSIKELLKRLDSDNDVGHLTAEEVDEAKRELWLLDQGLSLDAARVDWLLPLAKKSLGWIATKAAEAAVGAIAVGALVLVEKLVGL